MPSSEHRCYYCEQKLDVGEKVYLIAVQVTESHPALKYKTFAHITCHESLANPETQ